MHDDQTPGVPHPPEILEKFFDLQGREIDVRGQELERDRLNDANAHEYALKALEAQSENEARLVQLFADNSKRRWNWLLLISILFFAFCTICLFLNKDDLLTQIITYVATFAGGGGAGYIYGRKEKQTGQ